MGNNQCGLLKQSLNKNHDYQYISQQNHPVFGEIHHVKNQKTQQHIAIKKITFNTEAQYIQYKKFAESLMKLPGNLTYLKILKVQSLNSEFETNSSSNRQNKSKFKCEDQFIFKMPSQQNLYSCVQPQIKYSCTVHLQYFSYENFSLESIIEKKSLQYKEIIQNNRIAKNMEIQLFQKLKLNQYSKIDQLPPKQRKFINFFFNEIQILRFLDSLVSAVFGSKLLRLNPNKRGINLTPKLIFKDEENKIRLLLNQIIDLKSNFDCSKQNLRVFLQKNQSTSQNVIIDYIHPLLLPQLTQKQNDNKKSLNFTDQMNQKQNIFTLGLIIIQLCLFEHLICSKIYQVNNISKALLLFDRNTKSQIISQNNCQQSDLRKNTTVNVKFKQNEIKKYLSMMKVRYSDSLVLLVQKMIFNSYNQGLSKYQDVITNLTQLIKQNVEKLKRVYGSTKVSRPDSVEKTEKSSKDESIPKRSSNFSSNSSITIPTLSHSSSYSLLPLQSHQPILSYELLKKYQKRIQNKSDNLLLKHQILTLSDHPRKNEQKLDQLIQKDEKRILNQLNKIHINTKDNNVKSKNQRFSYRKLENQKKLNLKKTFNEIPKQQIGNFRQISQFNINHPKTNDESKEKQKRINSTKKHKKQKLQKTYQELMLGSVSCKTIDEKQRLKEQIDVDSKYEHIIQNKNNQKYECFLPQKHDLISLIKSKDKNKNNLGYKINENTLMNTNQTNSEKNYQNYMKQYQQLLEIEKSLF